MKKLFTFFLLITLIFSFSSISFANETYDVTKVLSEFEGDWSSVLPGLYLLSVAPIEERTDRFQIELRAQSSSKELILQGQVELIAPDTGTYNYVFNPEEEAEYTGGSIKFINKSIELSYIDQDNKKHVIIFNKKVNK